MSKEILQQLADRQTMNDVIRGFFRTRGYMEVETPLMLASPDMEPTLTPFETTLTTPDKITYRAALITSPEYSMKKLLGYGAQAIFTLAKVFRNEEWFDETHNPEFTMLEWYAQGKDMYACMDETEELVRAACAAFGKTLGNIERASIPELFRQLIAVDLAQATEASLRADCARLGVHTHVSDTESDLFYRLFLAFVEPTLIGKNVFVYLYPKSQAALSRLTPDGAFGERFELYLEGVEICNAFTELTDSAEQRTRFEHERAVRIKEGKPVFPIDETLLDLLASIRHPSFGNALGVDRLLMIATSKSSLEEVLPLSAKKLFK